MFDNILASSLWFGALFIFTMRVLGVALDVLRVLFVMRGIKLIAWIVGFLESLLFVVVITSVLSNLDQPLFVIAYAAGFATGGVVGVWIEDKLAIGYTHLQITSSRRGSAIAEKLRAEGFAVTEISARGRDGMVCMLSCNVRRKRVALVETIVRSTDEEAFVTSEDVRRIRRGFWRA
jgi:uncharacterized protein YebE (UPF0316 family)